MMHGGPGTAREKAVRVGRTVHSPAAITPTLTLPLKGEGIRLRPPPGILLSRLEGEGRDGGGGREAPNTAAMGPVQTFTQLH